MQTSVGTTSQIWASGTALTLMRRDGHSSPVKRQRKGIDDKTLGEAQIAVLGPGDL